MTRPAFSTEMRSAIRATSSRWWLLTRIPAPAAVRCTSASRNRITPAGSTADPALARAVYRIVQELLTNARKHAPGAQIRLAVSGGPADGVSIDARNPYQGPAAGGSGRGLQGIAERVELLGGQLAYGLDDGGATFRVTVTLPWRPPS